MTLNNVINILNKQKIEYTEVEYESVFDFWKHVTMFPNEENAEKRKVKVLVIESANGQKNVELQFNEVDDDYIFVDIFFGDYEFELYGIIEDMLYDALTDILRKIMRGKYSVIVVNNLTKKKFEGEGCFDMYEDEYAFNRSVEKIEKPKRGLARLKRSKIRYQIYDWNTYKCIDK